MSAASVRARLVSKSPLYSIPDSTYLIPVDWRRFHLSELINKLVSSPEPVPFDFVLPSTNELLSGTIEEYLKKNALGFEDVLEIEFLPSVLPPEKRNEWTFEDWISDISCRRDGWILSANYGGEVALNNASLNQEEKTSLLGKKAVLSTCWIGDPNQGEAQLAAGGIDCNVRIYKTDTNCSSLTETHTLPHTHHISTIRSSKTQIVTGDNSGHLSCYQISSGPSISAPPTKKRRTASSNGTSTSLQVLEPLTKWKSGNVRISRAIFDERDEGLIYSAGWDWSIRGYELESGSELFVRKWNQVILDLDQMPGSSVLLSGGFEGPIAAWDIRSSTTTPSILLPSSSPVATVRAQPNSTTMFLSASYDGKLRVWDLRSSKQSLYTVGTGGKGQAGGKKLLCADWSRDGSMIAAGGEEGVVRSWEISSIAPTS
ncbi:WD40 repeat-like protein [Atractiella rhizophila]|nr:WD40 repeat-like protein [Atractiella rhizophila]